ncbi:hypothetical protein NDI54_20940 [Haloarcula sp. S1AR25-5A]|uniref:Uncharacterized protein n=1 Tax=Haloarcula terrestris TaxID=2950533 RepID=A0AAE4F3C7_9EURY|nr:hypothetical protein [Haloarcula terrestris]MDS0223798.1 hypothetical protein [Haloarcula terrestris]
MGFFDWWSSNGDGSFTDTQDDGGESPDASSDDSNDSAGGDSTPEPTESQDRLFDGSTGGPSSDSDSPFDDSGPSTPEPPSPDNDNPFDDGGGSSSDGGASSSGSSSSGGGSSGSSGGSSGSDDNSPPVGNTPSSGNLPSQSGDSTEPSQGIGPGGVEGSEAATPDEETDSPDNDSTENIDATRTGRLEDTADDPRVREQAQSLEDQVAGQQVTDVVDGLNTTGAELREEDVEVTRDGDTLEAGLSPVGRERVRNIAERQADEQAERAVEDQLNEPFTNADVSVDNNGNVGVSEDVQQEATEQAIAGANPGVREDDVSFQNGQPQVEQPEPTDPAEQLEERTGLEEGQDFTVEDGQVNVTQRGAQQIQAREEQEQGDIFSGAVEQVEGVAGIDVPGDGSLVGRGREDAANANDDRFGDDLTGIDDTLAGAGRFVDDRLISPVTDTAGDVFALGQQGSQLAGAGNPVALALGTAGAQQSADALDDTETRVGDLARGDAGQQSDPVQLEAFGEGSARGAGAIANIPALAATGVDATEFTVEAGEQTVEGDGGEFAQEATEAGALRAGQGAEFASNNPTQFTGQVLGGALASTAAFGAGRAVAGARGAKAAGVAIQPGEEALRTALRGARAARRATPDTPDAPDLPDSLKRFIDDTRGQQTFGSRSDSDTSGSSTDTDTTTITAEDLGGTQARSSDLTRGGRFGSEPSGGRQPEATTDVPSGGDPTNLGFRSAETEQETGTTADADAKPQQDLREQAQQQEVTQAARTPGRSSAAAAAGVGAGVGAGAGDLVGQAEQSAVEDVFDDTGFGSATDTELNIGTGTGLELGQESRSETRTEFGQEFRSELGTEARTETRTETRTDQRQELGTETRTEIGQELRTETRSEQRQELRTELGFETSTRTETDVDLGDVFDDDESGPVDFGAADEVFDTGVVQSFDELNGGGSDDPLDGFDQLL